MKPRRAGKLLWVSGLECLNARLDPWQCLAVGAAGKTSHTDVVNLLWTNLVGSAPSPSQAAPIVALLDGGMTVGALTVLAADLDLNTTNIGLVGLVQTGIEYSL